MPTQLSPLRVPSTVFAGKATAEIEIEGEKAVLAIQTNAIAAEESPVDEWEHHAIEAIKERVVEVVSKDTIKGEIPLPEAEKVVSGGRGLKGPENWQLLMVLADVLGAATACSHPLPDSDWRAHHEHVGRPGLLI